MSAAFRRCAASFRASQAGRLALALPVLAITGDATYFRLTQEPPSWLGAALLLTGLALWLGGRRWPAARIAGALLTAFGLGFTSPQWAAAHAPPLLDLPRSAILSGTVSAIDARPSGARLTLRSVQAGATDLGSRTLRLTVGDAAGIAVNDRIAATARLYPPDPPAYPGGRDEQREAFFGHLAGTASTQGAARIVVATPEGWLTGLRARIAGRIRAVLPGPSGAVAATLMTGLAAAIPPATRQDYNDAGLAHLLAIAGLHIGIVMGLSLGFTRQLLLRSERVTLHAPVGTIASSVSLLAGLAYLLLTGAHIPILRAFTMACLVFTALLAGRRTAALRGWGLAVVVVILADPLAVTGAAFQLSFAAVLALIAGYEAARPALELLRRHRHGWALHHLASLLLTSLLAGAACLPLVAYHFGHIQLYFLLANLVAVPLFAFLVMPAGLLALALMPLHLEWLALRPMGWGIGLVSALAHWVALLPAATLDVPVMPHAALLCYAAGLAVLCLPRGQARLLCLPPFAASLLLAALARPPDLLYSADARLAAAATPSGLVLHPVRGGDRLVALQWQQWLGGAVSTCSDAHCLTRARRGGNILLADSGGDCAGVVALAVQSGTPPVCADVQPVAELGREDAWEDGAWAVWLHRHGSARMLSDRQDRGVRPWVLLSADRARLRIKLPFAASEPLPNNFR